MIEEQKQHQPPPLGPAWQGWESYRHFAQSVKADLRYVRSKGASNFLAEVLASCESRKITIPQEKIFWRARIGCEEEEVVDSEDAELSVSHIEDRVRQRPSADSATEKRALSIFVAVYLTYSDTGRSNFRIAARAVRVALGREAALRSPECGSWSLNHTLSSVIFTLKQHS
jgi:hypothetical protein